MIRIAICDDEILFLKMLAMHLRRLDVSYRLNLIVTPYASGEALFRAIEEGKEFDMMFLDVLMGEDNGIDVAKRIRAFNPIMPLTFISSSRDYVLDGYAVDAKNYILKPYQFEQLEETLLKMIDEFEQKKKDIFYYKTSQSISTILITNILYFESNRRVIKMIKTDGCAIEFYGKLDEIEDVLIKHSFIRSHRSFLINPRYIKDIDRVEVTLTTDERLPVSRLKYAIIKETFISYLSKY